MYILGTTWTQEMVWLIAHDFDTVAGKQPLTQRSPFLEYQIIAPSFSIIISLHVNPIRL